MKKIILAFCLAGLMGAEMMAQEINGVFIGAEIGVGEGQIKLDGGSQAATAGIEAITMLQTSAQFGGKIGYKYFFNEYFGIRGYGAVNYAFASKNNKGVNDVSSNYIPYQNYDVSFLNYTINADLLLNFYNGEVGIFGAFVGLGLGGSSVNYDDRIEKIQRDISGFYADAKVGLRASSGNHSMDFIATIPFVESKTSIDIATFNVDAKFKQNYAISLGYNYTF